MDFCRLTNEHRLCFMKFYIWKLHHIGVNWKQLESNFWKMLVSSATGQFETFRDVTFSAVLRWDWLRDPWESEVYELWTVGQIHQPSVLIHEGMLQLSRCHSFMPVCGCFHSIIAELQSCDRHCKTYQVSHTLWPFREKSYQFFPYIQWQLLFINTATVNTVVKWLTFLCIHICLCMSLLRPVPSPKMLFFSFTQI